MRVLNLYAGIGGNRERWSGVEVTAIELDPAIADVYRKRFPKDDVIVADAHQYLEDHFNEFNFIWTSPPCPSHGQYRHNVGVIAKGYKPIIPDMRLYGEIVFLQTYCRTKWVVENTVPYYAPLIPPTAKLQRHLFWSNFPLEEVSSRIIGNAEIRTRNKISDFDCGKFVANSAIKNKRQALRNCVDPTIGEAIINLARRKS